MRRLSSPESCCISAQHDKVLFLQCPVRAHILSSDLDATSSVTKEDDKKYKLRRRRHFRIVPHDKPRISIRRKAIGVNPLYRPRLMNPPVQHQILCQHTFVEIFKACLQVCTGTRPVHRDRINVEAAKFVCWGSLMVLHEVKRGEFVLLGKFLLIAQFTSYDIQTQCSILIVSLVDYVVEAIDVLALVEEILVS